MSETVAIIAAVVVGLIFVGGFITAFFILTSDAVDEAKMRKLTRERWEREHGE